MFNRKGHLLILLQILHKSKSLQMFCTKFVQFSSLDLVQSNLQTVTFALRLDHVTVVAALTPKMQKSARRACCVPTSILAPTRQLLSSWKGDHSNFGNSIPLLGMFDNHCGGLQFRWCLCMQNLDKSSNMRSLDRFTLWCRSVLPRTINLFHLFEKPAKENGSKMRLRDTPGIGLKDCFFGRCCSGAEFKMGEMRGRWCQSVIYSCSQWYHTPIQAASLSALIHLYRLPACVRLTHISTNSAINPW